MVDYAYTNNIPFAPNDPSVDQPKMQQNTNNINLLIAEDHYSFNGSNSVGGFHKQIRMPNLLTVPSGRVGNSGTIYTKQSQTSSQIFFASGTSTDEYQLTRVDSDATNFSRFGTNTNYTGPATTLGGWTFLPGNGTNGSLRFQWGTIRLLNTPLTSVVFPVQFGSLAYSITISTHSITGPPSVANYISVTNESTSGFDLRSQLNSSGTQCYWMAIGI